MSDDTVQDAAPAAELVDQAPAQAPDPALVAAIAAAVAAAIAPPPAPAPVTPASVPTTTPGDRVVQHALQYAGTPYTPGVPPLAPAPPVDEAPATPEYKAGALVVHSYDHFGRTQHQVLLVVDVYEATLTDPRTHQVTGTQTRLRMLPLASTHETADLPADAEDLQAADAFDWENAA